MTFSTLGLNQPICQQLDSLGFKQPTDIQSAAIPVVLAGTDVMAKAHTGSGKTAAFCLPIIQQLSTQEIALSAQQVLAVMLAPTRELAQQIATSLHSYCPNEQLIHELAYGGVAIDKQIKNLTKGAHILVATPGRLLDLLINHHINIADLRYLVLDEADRLLDMGFADDIKRIISFTNNKPQTLLFSATFDDRFFTFGKPLVRHQQVIDVTTQTSRPADIEQRIYELDEAKKLAATCHLIKQHQWAQVLVFVRSKKTADALSQDLTEQAIACSAIHGDIAQAKREQALAGFISRQTQVLVATDVAARGLHIPQLPVVINYQLPHQPADYIHRIGRTGRAGDKGLAISLLAVDEKHLLAAIEERLPEPPLRQWLPGFEPNLDADFSANNKKKKKGRSKRR